MPDVCRIFAEVSGSPGSVHALRQAADLARRNDAILIRFIPGKLLTGVARQAGDLLIISVGRRRALHRLWSCGVACYCQSHFLMAADTDRNEQSWTTRPLLRISGSAAHPGDEALNGPVSMRNC